MNINTRSRLAPTCCYLFCSHAMNSFGSNFTHVSFPDGLLLFQLALMWQVHVHEKDDGVSVKI